MWRKTRSPLHHYQGRDQLVRLAGHRGELLDRPGQRAGLAEDPSSNETTWSQPMTVASDSERARLGALARASVSASDRGSRPAFL